MNDPRPLYRELTSGSVGAAPTTSLVATRTAVNTSARELDEARLRLAGSWHGLGAAAALQCFERSSAELSAADAELAAAIDLFAALAAEQNRVAHEAAPLIQWWCRAYVLLFFSNPVLLALISAQVCAALSQLRVTHRAELQRIANGFDCLAGGAEHAVPTLVGVLVGAGGLPAAGTSPEAVAEWWKGLTAARQAALQTQRPDELAELDGIPPVVLDTVNRARLVRDRTRAQAAISTADRALQSKGLLGISDAELLSNRDPEVRRIARERELATGQLQRTNQVGSAVRSAQATAAVAPPIGPVLLLSYRNTGPGGLAIGFGDPSVAHDVAVTVPGTQAGPGNPSLEQASGLRREMDRRDPNGTHATVQWVDYDAPDTLGDPAVISSRNAEEGAKRLVGDVAGWRAASAGDQHLTVVGHSYGSTLVGFAGQQGLKADDIAVVGSPGMGASSAEGLSPGRGHVWAGGAEHDPVIQATQGSWFSDDGSGVGPYDKRFGANQFDAQDSASQLSAHSGYYNAGSPSLRNLAAIATGDYQQVTAADPGNSPTANIFQQLDEAHRDVARGGLNTATELLTLHPLTALHTAAATAKEGAGDVLDIALNGIGSPLTSTRALLKSIF